MYKLYLIKSNYRFADKLNITCITHSRLNTPAAIKDRLFKLYYYYLCHPLPKKASIICLTNWVTVLLCQALPNWSAIVNVPNRSTWLSGILLLLFGQSLVTCFRLGLFFSVLITFNLLSLICCCSHSICCSCSSYCSCCCMRWCSFYWVIRLCCWSYPANTLN